MTHTLYSPEDFTNEQVETETVARLVCLGGLGICKDCGAGEAQLDEFPTCEKYLEETHLMTVAMIGKCHAANKDVILWSSEVHPDKKVWLRRSEITWIEATPFTDEVVVMGRVLAIEKGLFDDES